MSDGDEGQVTTRLTERTAQIDLMTVLQLCGAGTLRCSDKTRRPGAATVSTVADALADGDFYPGEPIAAFAWPLLIQAGGLAEIVGGRLRLTARGQAALTRPAAGTIRDLWRAWVGKGLLDELSRVEQIKGQRIANVLTAAKNRRKTVATALAGCEPGAWIEIDDLFARMRRRGVSPTVARSDRALWRLYLVDAEYGSLGYAGFGDWPILEGRYTLAVVFEYAATLGLLDVRYVDPAGARDDFRGNWGADELDYLSRYDGLLAVRLNALGSYALGASDAYQPPAAATPEKAVLKVLPNRDVVATGTISTADRLMLDAYATATSERVWPVETAGLLTAINAGRSLEQFVEFLSSRSAGELPAAVTTLITDVTDRASALRDAGMIRLIECADPALATLIARNRRLQRICRPLGDRYLAVEVGHEPAFRKALLALGYVLPPDAAP